MSEKEVQEIIKVLIAQGRVIISNINEKNELVYKAREQATVEDMAFHAAVMQIIDQK